MSRLVRGIGRGIVDGLTCMMSRPEHTSGLVRMFEIEYNKEARCARRAGAHIDENFVRTFLSTNLK